jgi:hypothetical protein
MNNPPDLFALNDTAVRSALLGAGWAEGSGPTAGRWRCPVSGCWFPTDEALALARRRVAEDDGLPDGSGVGHD